MILPYSTLDGEVTKASANRTATCINILHPFPHLFEESFKKIVLTYMTIGRAVEERDATIMAKLETMIESTHTLLVETVEEMIRKLG